MIEIQEGYYVTRNGEILSNRKFNKPTPMKPFTDKEGYMRVKLLGKTKKVHRLVAQAFIPNPDNKPTVNHIDGNRSNNCVENLEWATYSENKQHAYDTGLTKGYTGRKDHGNNKYGKEWTDLKNSGYSLRKIGKLYNVCHHTVKRTIIKYAEGQGV
jgi:hypothetical protein